MGEMKDGMTPSTSNTTNDLPHTPQDEENNSMERVRAMEKTEDSTKRKPKNTKRLKSNKPLVKLTNVMEPPEITNRNQRRTENNKTRVEELNDNPYKKIYKPRSRNILEINVKHRENERDKPLDRIILKEMGAELREPNTPMTIKEITNNLTQIPPTEKLTRIEQDQYSPQHRQDPCRPLQS